jgi:hypothetical protein
VRTVFVTFFMKTVNTQVLSLKQLFKKSLSIYSDNNYS